MATQEVAAALILAEQWKHMLDDGYAPTARSNGLSDDETVNLAQAVITLARHVPEDDFPLKVAQWEANHLALTMQCAYIECWEGAGESTAMDWISNALEIGDFVPTGDHSTNADEWWDAHYQPAPMPPMPPTQDRSSAFFALGDGSGPGDQPERTTPRQPAQGTAEPGPLPPPAQRRPWDDVLADFAAQHGRPCWPVTRDAA